MQIEIWGVRGGIASSGPQTAHYGGNTPCVSVETADGTLVILDAGTGVRALGERIAESGQHRPIHIVLSHFHWDHVQGLPFFAPLWRERFEVNIYAAYAPAQIERAVHQQFAAPFFPVSIEETQATIRFHDVRETRNIGGLRIASFEQYHPQGSTGYRLEAEGAAFVYATDSEGGVAATDAELERHAKGADVLLLDAQYTPAEIVHRRRWGHGDWQRACDVAQRSGVNKLLLFHHDPARTDDEMRKIEAQAKQVFRETEAAQERASFRF